MRRGDGRGAQIAADLLLGGLPVLLMVAVIAGALGWRWWE